MSDTPSIADMWQQRIFSYEELISRYGWHQGPMLAFVRECANSPAAHVVFPSASHEALGLALVPTYDERLKSPMVYVRYWGTANNFTITFQSGQAQTVKEISVNSMDQAAISKIIDWLNETAAVTTRPGAA